MRAARALTAAAAIAAGLALAALAATDDPLRAAAARIVASARDHGQAFAIARHLCDHIGPRLSGSKGAEEAVRWTRQRFADMGLRAWTEPVRVPRWVRGEESGEVVSPVAQPLALTALGGSAATAAGGLTADVVEVASLHALQALPREAVEGRIVFFNHDMSVAGAYGRLSPLRSRGPAEAGRRGAAAALVRSLGTLSARLPHTGATTFRDGETPIPAAALAAEDADLLHRLLAAGGPVRVTLRLGCRTLEDVESANVLAEIRGRETADEVVLIGAHLDSWDLGTGAIDDAAGVAMVMETMRLLKELGLTPRRTVRAVLFMNEENGLRGGRAYAEAHAGELARHVAAMESDSGAGDPAGVSARVGPGGLALVRQLNLLAREVSSTDVEEGVGGADLLPLIPAGVPQIGLRHDSREYFHWHHTRADTLDKIDPARLAAGAARMAVLAYALAETGSTLPRPPAPSPVPSAYLAR